MGLPPHDDGAGVAGAAFDDLFADPKMMWSSPSYGDFFLPDEGFDIFNEYEMYGTAGAVLYSSRDGRWVPRYSRR